MLMTLIGGVACTPREMTPPPLPTVASVDMLATAAVLTAIAPPMGYDVLVGLERIDAGLLNVSGWTYSALAEFEGVVSRTDRPAYYRQALEVSYHQVATARRVVFEFTDNLGEQPDEAVRYEGVQLGQDVFLVRDDVCLAEAEAEARAVANLMAGDLLGGVVQAPFAERRATINGEQVWAYQIMLEHFVLPRADFSAGTVTSFNAELWYSPTHNVAIRYYVTMAVDNVRLFDSPLPLTGTLILRYDVSDVGTAPNISVPFGC